jgi:hypothetical protein
MVQGIKARHFLGAQAVDGFGHVMMIYPFWA